nr:WAT1-related protein At3g28050-like [Quercus suber]POE96002.1 wat1-related protein [Quercus suber]
MLQGKGVTLIMITVECLDVGLNTISKAAMTGGMSDFIFVTYSNVIAIFFLLSSCLIFYRKRSLPPLTWGIVGGVFLVALLSSTVQMLKAFGIGYSSPTMSSVMSDLLPAFTFVLAVICRFEKLDLRLRGSQARSIGTIVSITGALVVTLYKGIPISIASLPEKVVSGELLSPIHSNWILGGFFSASAYFLLAVTYIVQTWVVRDYPAELMFSLIRCTFVTILSAIISLSLENDPNAWKLNFDMELIAVLYSALFAITIRNSVHLWACHKKGPVYVAMFKPLGIVIAVVMGVTYLGDTLYLGSVVGAAIIVLGFYAVIWGQAQEDVVVEHLPITSSYESSSPNAPLLQNKGTEE